MGFRLQQKLMTLNNLEHQFTALSSELAFCDQTAEARITRFSLWSSTIPQLDLLFKFDYEIEGNPFEFQPQFPISLRQS